MQDKIHQPLLDPYMMGDLPLRNRVVMAPLTRTRAANPGHVPTEVMREYYQQRASAGLIISEGVWVSENGQGWHGAPGIYNAEQGAAWKSITDAVHASGGRTPSFGIKVRCRTRSFSLTVGFLSRPQRSIRSSSYTFLAERL